MNVRLPTAKELEKLPMRAVVAYAARTARRVSAEFCGIVADDILDDALRLVEAVSTTDFIGEVDQASVVRASQRVVEAYVAAPASMKSIDKFYLVFCFVQAALAAASVIEAAANPENVCREMKRAAQQAELAVCPIKALSGEAASSAKKAARRDYEVLREKYGEHEEVVIGDAVDCFDSE